MRDRIDSRDEMFQNSTVNVLNAIATLSRETYAIRRKRAKPGRKKPEKGSMKQKRNEKCVEMYQTGIPIKEIQKQAGFRSKSSVFRILRDSGVKLNRRSVNEEE